MANVVVEAGEHSMTRTQARNAMEHGRPVLLTTEVVRANQWAQSMMGNPGVHEVAEVSEVLRIVERADDSSDAVYKLLNAVAS